MKHRKLKTNIPRSAKEWLEYQEHRERWTPEMQTILDKHIKDTFPLTPDDKARLKKLIEEIITSHWKKPS
ncbi:MAG: hypothetical protein Q8M71_05725 [Thermodesulfovibrionales bacterium]|nr:hypothetical protein [Thermodesulfovibrionales bacterium]